MLKTFWTDVVQSRVHVGNNSKYVGTTCHVNKKVDMLWGFVASSENINKNLCSTCIRMQRVCSTFVRICSYSVRHFFDTAMVIELFYFFLCPLLGYLSSIKQWNMSIFIYKRWRLGGWWKNWHVTLKKLRMRNNKQ